MSKNKDKYTKLVKKHEKFGVKCEKLAKYLPDLDCSKYK
jgi:hypothetical protein